MGRYYALEQGMSYEVADAIQEHYSPLGPNDASPTKPVSVTLALAEKIDTLVGFFGIGEFPTGSKDPFALRRAALGVIRLIVENGIKISLAAIFSVSTKTYFEQGFLSIASVARADGKNDHIDHVQKRLNHTLFDDPLLSFFADRLKVVLKERGVRHDLVDAVFALGGEDDLVRLLARVQALQDFLATPDGANLLAAYKRAANILKIEEKRDGVSYDGTPDATLLSLDEERALATALENAGSTVDPLIASEDFQGAMAKYAELRPVVDAFFDGVTVNADQAEVRVNRLRLLSRIPGTLNKIADFSRIA
jgi:glycyl-tRNA synthetase beta chain